MLPWLAVPMLFLVAWGQPDPKGSVPLQNADESLGPFVLVGQSFTVVLHSKFVEGVPASVLTRTLVKIEVRDQSGTALYQKAFPYELEGHGFQQTVTASARLLAGDNLTGLLITYIRQPALPGSEQSWQVFGFREGKLALLDPPRQDSAANQPPGFAGVVMITPNGPRTMPIPARGPLDTVELRAWTGNFYVDLPLRVDWRAGKLLPGEKCLESGGGPGLHEVGCYMRVEAKRVPNIAEFQFARIFPTPEEQTGISVQHAVIPKGSEIQLLKAKSIATWVIDGDLMRVQFPDMWLKVLINNNTDNEGWVHGEEDLTAIGLPARNPLP